MGSNDSNVTCGHKFYLEITGIDHKTASKDKQKILFYEPTNITEQFAVERSIYDETAERIKRLEDKEQSLRTQDTTVYSWDWSEEKKPRNVWLEIQQPGHKVPIRVLLFNKVQANKYIVDGEQDYVIQSVVPMTLLPSLDESLKDEDRIAPVREGYIYITYNNRFWREIQVSVKEETVEDPNYSEKRTDNINIEKKKGFIKKFTPCFRDVHLYNYRDYKNNSRFYTDIEDKKERKVTGVELEEIWFPARKNKDNKDNKDNKENIESIGFAFSEVQWTNDRLNYLEIHTEELKRRMKFIKSELINNICELPEMRPRDVDKEINMDCPSNLNRDITGDAYRDCFDRARQQLDDYWKSDSYDWYHRSHISFEEDLKLKKISADSNRALAISTSEEGFYHYKFNQSDCNMCAKSEIINILITEAKENKDQYLLKISEKIKEKSGVSMSSLDIDKTPEEYIPNYIDDLSKIRNITFKTNKTYIFKKWIAEKLERDFLEENKKRKLRYLYLDDPVFDLYYLLCHLYKGFQYLHRSEKLSTFDSNYKSAQVLKNFVLPDISSKIKNSIDLGNNGVYSKSIKLILLKYIKSDIEHIKNIMLRTLNKECLLLSFRDIISSGYKNTICIHKLLNECLKLLMTDNEINKKIKSKDYTNSEFIINLTKLYNNKYFYSTLYSDDKDDEEYDSPNKNYHSSASGRISPINLKHLKLNSTYDIVTFKLFDINRAIFNSARDVFCGHYMAIRTLNSYGELLKLKGHDYRIMGVNINRNKKIYEEIVNQSSILTDDLKELFTTEQIIRNPKKKELIYFPGVSNKIAEEHKLLKKLKKGSKKYRTLKDKLKGTRENGCFEVKEIKSSGLYDNIKNSIGFNYEGNERIVSKLNNNSNKPIKFESLDSIQETKKINNIDIYLGKAAISHSILMYIEIINVSHNFDLADENGWDEYSQLCVSSAIVDFSCNILTIANSVGVINVKEAILDFLGVFGGFLTAGIFISDGEKAGRKGDFNTEIFSFTAACGALAPLFGLTGPVGVILTLVGLIGIALCTDKDIHTWIKSSPFAKKELLIENNLHKYFKNKPDDVYKQLINILIKSKVETNDIATLKNKLNMDVNKSRKIFDIFYTQTQKGKTIIKLNKAIHNVKISTSALEQILKEFISELENKQIKSNVIDKAHEERIILHKKDAYLLQVFRTAHSAKKTLNQIGEIEKKEQVTHGAYLTTNLPHLFNSGLEQIEIHTQCRETIISRPVSQKERDARKIHINNPKGLAKSCLFYDEIENWTVKEHRYITPIKTIQTDYGILYLFNSFLSYKISNHDEMNMNYRKISNIDVLYQIQHDRFIFPQPPLESCQDAHYFIKKNKLKAATSDFEDKKVMNLKSYAGKTALALTKTTIKMSIPICIKINLYINKKMYPNEYEYEYKPKTKFPLKNYYWGNSWSN